MPYNIINCGGWASEAAATGWMASTDCLKGRIGVVLLFFIVALVRKWGGEEMGFEFSFLFALIFGLLTYLIVITISGSFKFALGLGLVTSLIGGYGAGIFFGGEGE